MEGQQFLAINPDTLNDKETWSYRDIQKVCKTVGIKSNQKREILIVELETWHRARKDGTQTMVDNIGDDENTENIDMNVVGNNFSILAIDVKERSTNAIKVKRRGSMVGIGLKDNATDSVVVSPSLLRPLRNDGGTPGKSCLRKPGCQSPAPAPSNKLSNICFSPFNGVKIISHREELDISPFRGPSIDYDDGDDDYEDDIDESV